MAMRWSSWIRPIRKVKTRESQEVLQRLQLFLESDDVIKTPVRILTRFWEDQQHAIGYSELRQIVQDGTVSPEALQLWSQDYSVLVANQFYSVWMDAVKAGAARQPLLDDVPFSFRAQTKGILNWIRDRGAEFVTACTEEQKRAIATLLTKSIRDHHTVEELSQMIRPCIGLTKEQAKANFRYYHTIATNLRNEHPRMKAESIQRKAQEAAQKYAERQHRQRAMTIAQTESAFAYNYGADESIRQAQAQNLLGEVKKRWCTSGDDAVCEICASLDGMELEMDVDFKIKGKALFRGQHRLPPAHPRCACAVEYVEVEKKGDAFVGFSEGNDPIFEMVSASEQETDNLLRGILNECKQKIKIIYDNITRNNPPIMLSELRGRHAKKIYGIIENAPEHYKKFFVACEDDIFFLKTDAVGRSRFNSEYNGIFINLKTDEHNERGAYTATFHEIGHHVDKILNNVSNTGDFGMLLKTDAQNFLVAYSQMNGYNIEEALYDISDAIWEATGKQCHVMSDLFSGIYGNGYNWKYRHSDNYWLKEGKLESEAFAHFFSASVLSDAEKLETIESVFPKAYGWFDELIQEMVQYE